METYFLIWKEKRIAKVGRKYKDQVIKVYQSTVSYAYMP